MAKYRKFLVALAAAAGALVTANIDNRVTHIASAVIAVLGALGVYAVPNEVPNESGPA